MGVNSLPKTLSRQRRDCDLNPAITKLRRFIAQSVNEKKSKIGEYLAKLQAKT